MGTGHLPLHSELSNTYRRPEEIGIRNKSIQVGKGLVRASSLLGFVAAIGHWKADLGRMQGCTQMAAGPWARQHAGEPPEDKKGQSADSGVSLLPSPHNPVHPGLLLSAWQPSQEGSESKDDDVNGDEGKW